MAVLANSQSYTALSASICWIIMVSAGPHVQRYGVVRTMEQIHAAILPRRLFVGILPRVKAQDQLLALACPGSPGLDGKGVHVALPDLADLDQLGCCFLEDHAVRFRRQRIFRHSYILGKSAKTMPKRQVAPDYVTWLK